MNILTLVLALIAVESSGDDNARGDNNLAYGALQLDSAYVADAAEYANKDWKHEDAFDRKTAIDIFLAYMSRYATEKRLGRPVTIEDIARIHNGGPNGYKKDATLKYWKKVERELISSGALAPHNQNT